MTELELGQKWRVKDTDIIWRITELDYKQNRMVAYNGIDKYYETFKLDSAKAIFNTGATLLTEETKETIVSPKHYMGDQGLEVETVLQNFVPRYDNSYISHRVASSIEYLLRAPLKNGLEDLKKARKNLDQAIEYYENNRLTEL